MSGSDEPDIEYLFLLEPGTAYKGSMDHVLEILASYNHPLMLVGCSAQRWMGSAGAMNDSCDLLLRDTALENVASDPVDTGNWESHVSSPHIPG